ncbi:MAG TPA: hypothetical protein VMF08_17670 [Candidatus Sulfotelmatobacter sp.]|nr:hypothetical protein [Candidatus Sulfotelmatobacter sp.]
MRTRALPTLMAIVITGCLAIGTCAAQADAPYAVSTAPQQANSVTDIIRLSQAKVSDDAIINFIKNSGDSYHLDAGQIIYLKNEGVSEPVIDAMLRQQGSGGGGSAATQPMPAAQFVGTADTGSAVDSTPPDASTSWPLVFNNGSTTYTVFQPQIDSWDGHNLVARSAVGIQLAGQSQPAYGVIGFSAITLVDKNTRAATLVDVKITSASGQARDYLDLLQQEFPKRAPAMTLDRLQASLSMPVPPKAETLNNVPPKIIVAMRPAVLVSIDGPPVWKPVAGTDMQRVINTQMLLLKDPSGHYYLHVYDGYMQADSLKGPWTVATETPDVATAAEAVKESGEADLMSGEPNPATGEMPTLSASMAPDVFVATTPSELISFNGQPQYAPIAGTDLLYAENTSGNVFKSLNDQQFYILISGRWYSAPGLEGPWQFVPGNKLPADFVNIPDTSPKENVKASVPGTTQAQEALIANSIPQSAAVARTTQMADPQIDGTPQLAPIEGTPLYYVVNSATPIIRVDAQDWYACQNGVWYVSTSPNGPWSVAASVPEVIYTIPTTSPLHYLTYVHVYDSTPDQVYEGYTPGYMGTEVADDDTVVYGTGYDYQPWIGSDVCYYPPITWGWGFAPCWTPWCGWGFGTGFGWGCGWGGFGLGWGFYPPFPCWGGFGFGFHHGFAFNNGFNRGFNHGFNKGFAHGFNQGFNHGFANTSMNLFHQGDFARGFGANGFNRGTWGGAYNSRTGNLAAGQRAQVQRVTGSAWNPAGAGLARSGSSGAVRFGVAGGSRGFSGGFGVARGGTAFANPGVGNFNRSFSGSSLGVFHNSFGPFGTRSGGVFTPTFPNFGNRGFSTFGNRGFSTFGNRGFSGFARPGFGGFQGGCFRGGFSGGGFGGGGFRGGFSGGGFHGGFGGGFHGGGGGGFHGGGGGGGRR